MPCSHGITPWRGTYGAVFRGGLKDGTEVAIKVSPHPLRCIVFDLRIAARRAATQSRPARRLPARPTPGCLYIICIVIIIITIIIIIIDNICVYNNIL